ncbi:hypothetical protein E4U14_002686 [Claviceps sp. LM454 group G7]|nr:hypothetical protein E4U14_002686 [Claviceps sp. LM454 group G7]
MGGIGALCIRNFALWDSVYTVSDMATPYGDNQHQSWPLCSVLRRLFQALDLLHQECHIAHTDIQERNILVGADKSVLEALEKDELEKPSPRKDSRRPMDGPSMIYLSRKLGIPKKVGDPVLCDDEIAAQSCGWAMVLRAKTIKLTRQTRRIVVYRAPKGILGVPTSTVT